MIKFVSDRPRAERKLIKQEFEAEILPKMLECLEVVRQRAEQKNGGELAP